MRFWLVLGVLVLAACQPGDQKAKSVKDRLNAGELVEFTKPGYRRPACSDRAPDWTDARGLQEQDRERIILANQKAVLNPGKYSCFRIGTAINLGSQSKKQEGGRAIIVKLGIRKLDKLEAKDLGGGVYAQASEFYALKDKTRAILTDRDEGFVTIVTLQYIPDSAADEKAIREKVAKESDSDGLVETQKDGDTVSTCNSKWTELLAPEAFQADLVSGKLRTIYRYGDLNCIPQGSLADVKTKQGDPSKGQVRILKVKKLRTAFLDARYFANAADFEALDKAIKGDRAKKEWITLTLVEPATAPVAEACTYRPNPVTIVYPTKNEEALKEPRWTVQLKGKTCYAAGELVTVNIVTADNMASVTFPARVVSQSIEGEGSTVVLENLGVIK